MQTNQAIDNTELSMEDLELVSGGGALRGLSRAARSARSFVGRSPRGRFIASAFSYRIKKRSIQAAAALLNRI